MEALQACATSTEPQPKPALRRSEARSSSDFNCARSSPAGFPSTPSFIEATSSSSGPEPAVEPLSMITPTTTTTEPSSDISTAATSVLLLVQVSMVQRLYISPNMPIDEEIRLVWARQIRSRLSAVLLLGIPWGTCVQEFMMVGRNANALKPTVVITCGEAETKRKVEKVFKSQAWLQHLLKANGIMFVALVAKTALSAGPALSPSNIVTMSESYSVQLMHGSGGTCCGLPLLIHASETHPQRHCTLGGLLIVNGKVLGLTAGHPFRASFERRPTEHELNTHEDEEGSVTSPEPFIFNEEDGDGNHEDPLSTPTVSFPGHTDLVVASIDEPTHEQHDISNSFSPSVKWSQPANAIIPLPIPQALSPFDDPIEYCDWALLEMLPRSLLTLPNRNAVMNSHHDILIDSIISEPAHGDVSIMVAAIGIRRGVLQSSPSTMQVNGSILNVQLITLEQPLPLGSSGAWVILGEKLCGFIVATRSDLPGAYMMPIEPMIEDIKRKFGTADVRLPERGEIESLAQISEVSEATTVLEQDVPKFGSDDKRVSKDLEFSEIRSALPFRETRRLPTRFSHRSNREDVQTGDDPTIEKSPELSNEVSRKRNSQSVGDVSVTSPGIAPDTVGSGVVPDYSSSGFVWRDPRPPFKGAVDVIAVSAVGAHPEHTWQAILQDQDGGDTTDADDSSFLGVGPSWITQALRQKIPFARVLIYNHGKPNKDDDLDRLAARLLQHVISERKDDASRPLFFVCHSTGGLVVKAALIQAQSESELRSVPIYRSIKYHCYGVTFFATPHQGSSFLSSPAFDISIKKVMRLIHPVPKPLQGQLEVNSKKLVKMSLEFNRVAAEMKLFSFYETIDTNLAPTANGTEVVIFTAPIVSIKSAVLELHHEVERPLDGNHANCAAFGKMNNYAQWSYLEKLEKVAKKSLELCTKDHIELNLKDVVEVEVHGFYEAGDNPSSEKAPIRLWTTKTPLKYFLVKGPAACLHEFLEENTQGPEPAKTPTETLGTPSTNRDMRRIDRATSDHAHGADSWGTESTQISRPLLSLPSTPNRTFRRSSSEGGTSPRRRRYTETGLTRPNINNQKLTWIHLPFNNPTWCADMLKRIADEKHNDCYLKMLEPKNWQKKHIWGRHTEYHACFMKPGCNLLFPEIESLAEPSEPYPSKPLEADIQMSLYFPYLHWDTYKRMVRRRDIIKERIAQGRSRPTPVKVAKLDMEHKVSWRYLSYDPPFNTRRTLDQFGYPNLLDTRARDDDQMLYKMTKVPKYIPEFSRAPENDTMSDSDDEEDEKTVDKEGKSSGKRYERLKDGKVLMVDQVWLWIVDNTTAVSFFPKREPINIEGRLYQQADLRNSIYNEVNGDLSRRCENSLDLSALVALHAVTLLFERASHRDLEIFRIFEESISILVEKMTVSFKYFRAKGFRATADEEDTREDASSMKKRHKLEGRQFQEQIRDNVSALLELRDIGDELGTLKKLFEQQQESLEHMLSYYERCGHGKTNGCLFLHEAQLKLKDYLHQIHQMMESADRTKNDFEKLLDLVQRQANVDEARLSRWQADVQGVQSRAVMIFTVFNIIFLPLTFFTGLFGMNVREWGGAESSFTPANTVAEISIPISAIIIGSALSFALSTRVRGVCSFAIKFIFHPFEDTEPTEGGPDPDGAALKPARKIRKYKPKQKRDEYGLNEKDFWQEHREKLDVEYLIPVHNQWLDKERGKGGQRRRKGGPG